MTTTHLHEFLFVIKKDNNLFASNSMPFVLMMAQEELNPDYYDYEYDFNTSLLGYYRSRRTTPLLSGNMLMTYRGCTLYVSPDLSIEEQRHNPHFLISDFSSYKDTVTGILSRIVDNAQSPYRKFQYGMATTISRGYDACASSALAKAVGCDTSLSLISPAKYLNDDGRDIAIKMGYTHLVTADADEYKNNVTLEEAKNLCTGGGGGTLFLAGFSSTINGRLLFTGRRGDSIWERKHLNVNNDLDFSYGNPMGQGSIEEALFGNFIEIPVPLICGNQWEDIARISNSEEMKPWSVRDRYDRPIARRLVEEMGVPRDSFGQQKAGAGVTVDFETIRSVRRKMSEKSYEDFLKFCKNIHRNKFKSTLYSLRFYGAEYPTYFNHIMRKLRIKIRFKDNTEWISSPTNQLLILWATNVMVDKYKSLMQK